jgi:hypothetical protein
VWCFDLSLWGFRCQVRRCRHLGRCAKGMSTRRAKPAIRQVLRRTFRALHHRWRKHRILLTATNWWTIPGEKTKNGLAHRVYLAPQSLRIIEEARRLRCSLLTCNPAWLGLRTQIASLAPCQRVWGPAAECAVISAQALSGRPRERIIKKGLPKHIMSLTTYVPCSII